MEIVHFQLKKWWGYNDSELSTFYNRLNTHVKRRYFYFLVHIFVLLSRAASSRGCCYLFVIFQGDSLD